MKKNSKKIIVAGVALGMSAGIALNWKEIKRIFQQSGGGIEDGFKDSTHDINFPIYPSNSRNPFVVRVQQAMLKHPLAKSIISSTGGADGIYGNGTKEALQIMLFNPNRISKQDYDSILKQAGMAGLSGLGCLCELQTPEGWKAPFNLTLRQMDGNTIAINKGELIGQYAGAKEGIAVFVRNNEPVAFKYQ